MDQDVQQLQRAYQAAPSPETAQALGHASLRAGRPRRALSLARAHDLPALREAACGGLAARLGLTYAGLRQGVAWFTSAGWKAGWALIPAGAYLEDGPSPYESLLSLRGSRAALRRVELPDLLVGLEPQPGDGGQDPSGAAAAISARLLTPGEWKKCWRGGLFLDGDEAGRVPNPEPDRVMAWSSFSSEALMTTSSPCGLSFTRACEWTRTPEGDLFGMQWPGTRYQVELGEPDQRRGRTLVWRPVLDLPPE
jgi:hypothetical protein